MKKERRKKKTLRRIRENSEWRSDEEESRLRGTLGTKKGKFIGSGMQFSTVSGVLKRRDDGDHSTRQAEKKRDSATGEEKIRRSSDETEAPASRVGGVIERVCNPRLLQGGMGQLTVGYRTLGSGLRGCSKTGCGKERKFGGI